MATCLGVIKSRSGDGYSEQALFDDLTVVDALSDNVRPLLEEDLWFDEAVRSFREMLAGKHDKIEIPLMDMGKITAKYVPPDKAGRTKAGLYYVHFKFWMADGEERDTTKYKKPWGIEFKPTAEEPTILHTFEKSFAKARQEALDQGKEVRDEFEILSIQRAPGKASKAWCGVFGEPNARSHAQEG